MTASSPTFQMPRESRSAATSGAAGFLGVVLALALVALGATGYYVFTHSGAGAPVMPLPAATPTDAVVASVAAVELPPAPAVAVAPVRLLCNVPGARLARGSVDLGDCGAPLPVPDGDSWEIDISAPGHVSRRVVVFAGQGDVPISLTRRSGGSPRPSNGGATSSPPRRGGDVRNPWD